MTKKSSLSNSNPGFFAELWQQAKLVVQLLFDSQVPTYLKIVPFAAIAYLLFPFDFLPDVVPGLGQLDDITILLVGAKVFIELAPKDVVAKYIGRLQNPGPSADLKEGSKAFDGAQGDDNDIIEGIIVEGDE